jgi:hypothetical protein
VKVGEKWGFINKRGEFKVSAKFDKAYAYAEGFAGVELDGKVGFVDKQGLYLVTPQFESDIDWPPNFSCGLAAVQVAGKWGYINHKGKMIIAPTFIGAWPFMHDLALVAVSERVSAWIDKKGRLVWSSTDNRLNQPKPERY